MSGFTKGPWTVCFAIAGDWRGGDLLGWHITGPKDGSVDPICERRDGFDRSQRPDDEERANAALLAAAPDLYEALRRVTVGGNHLASVLIGRLGAGFAEKFPPTADVHETLESLGSGVNFDVWCCWSAIMAARAALAKASPPQKQNEGDA